MLTDTKIKSEIYKLEMRRNILNNKKVTSQRKQLHKMAKISQMIETSNEYSWNESKQADDLPCELEYETQTETLHNTQSKPEDPDSPILKLIDEVTTEEDEIQFYANELTSNGII